MLDYGMFFSQITEWIHNQADMVLFAQVSAVVLFAFIFITAILSEWTKNSEVIFLLLGIITISMFRSFTLFADSYNPDEGMHLANAIALEADFKPWGVTDFTTFGPVNAILVILLGKVLDVFLPQAGFTYFSLRLLNIILLAMSFVLFERCLCKSVQQTVSKAVSMLFVIFYAFHMDSEILAFNAETTYIFFVTFALYLLYQLHCRIRRHVLFIFGIACGIMPYIKLQTVPMCAVLVLGGYYIVIRSVIPVKKNGIRNGIKLFAVLSSGIILPTGLLGIYLLTYENGLKDAWFFYIENAKSHIGNPGLTQYLSQFVKLLDLLSPDALKISIMVAVSLAVLILVLKLRLSDKFLFSVLLLSAAAFGTVRSFNLFYHYINFLVVPVLLFLAETVQMLWDNEEYFRGIYIKKLLLAALFICAIREFGIFYEEVKTNTVFSSRQVAGESNPNLTEAAAFIMNHTSADDSIVVWGWESRIFVYAKRRSATRQTDIQRLFPPYDEHNVELYISDIYSNNPKYIIDIVAPGSFAYSDADIYAIERYEAVWNAVRDRYLLVQTMLVDGGSYKIYERNVPVKD